jgi:peptide-methionine (S)-S-oxide reductase
LHERHRHDLQAGRSGEILVIRRGLALAALALTLAMGGAAAQQNAPPEKAVAVFAGGCFWCVESDFDKVPGVISTTSGYSGGKASDATYQQVSAGSTEHYEVLQVVYDPSKVTYAKLLDVFWRNVDPHDASGQFCDKGPQYRAAIFVQSDTERQLAQQSKQALEQSGRLKKPIVTEIVRASAFYPAEDYHQDYYLKNPLKYKFYRTTCGRDARLSEVWGAATN